MRRICSHISRRLSSVSQFAARTCRPAAVLACTLLLVACEWSDPRYPAYYRYQVDVKVDGIPVTIERVIKCTGTLVTDWMVSPGTTTGADYRNPPVIGAYVPGSKAAVYTPVIHACRWASASPREIRLDRKKVHRFLDRPFTEEHWKLKPDSKMPVLWVNDSETFDRMEYYVSETGLSGKHGHVEFIKVHPPVKVDWRAFRASEKRAETESPDLTPFIFPRDKDYAHGTETYKQRGMGQGNLIVSVCYGAWRIPHPEWSKVPGLEEWVAALPNDGRAYLISTELWPRFTETLTPEGWRKDPSLVPVGYVSKNKNKKVGRFETYDTIYPAISTSKGRFVDLEQAGSFGCNYDALHPDRSQTFWSNKTYSDDTPMGPSFTVDRDRGRLWAAFSQRLPVYVRELDEFIVFVSLAAGPKTLDEPVVKGWRE